MRCAPYYSCTTRCTGSTRWLLRKESVRFFLLCSSCLCMRRSVGRIGRSATAAPPRRSSPPHPGSQPAGQPASHAASRPGRQTASQPAGQPASRVLLCGVALLYESPGGNQVDGLPPVPTFLVRQEPGLNILPGEHGCFGFMAKCLLGS